MIEANRNESTLCNICITSEVITANGKCVNVLSKVGWGSDGRCGSNETTQMTNAWLGSVVSLYRQIKSKDVKDQKHARSKYARPSQREIQASESVRGQTERTKVERKGRQNQMKRSEWNHSQLGITRLIETSEGQRKTMVSMVRGWHCAWCTDCALHSEPSGDHVPADIQII